MRYKWLEKIPEHWDCQRGKQIFYTQKQKNEGNIETNILSLTLNGVIRNSKDNPVGLIPSDYATYQIFEKDNLVFKLIDLENISTSRVGIVPERGIMSPAYIRLIAREVVNVRYFYYQYYSWWLRNIFNGLGGGVRQTLSAADLLNINIAIPPRDEQDAIVCYLDDKCGKIDKLLGAYEREVKTLDELKKATINEAVKGDWKRVRLKYIATLNPYCSHEGLKPEDEVTFAPMECIRTNKRIDRNAPLTNCNSSYSSFNEGDIALAKVTPCFQNSNVCLMTNLTNGYAFGSSELFNIRANSIHSKFLLYYFMSAAFIAGGVASMTGVAGLQRVSSEYIRNALVPVPPLSEQQAIAEYLDEKCGKIDMAINLKRRHIKLWQEYKARLISDVVTGQLDIRGVNDNGNRYE